MHHYPGAFVTSAFPPYFFAGRQIGRRKAFTIVAFTCPTERPRAAASNVERLGKRPTPPDGCIRCILEPFHKLEKSLTTSSSFQDINRNEPVAMMAALQCRIGKREEDILIQFYTTSLRYLTAASGKKVDVTPWTITSFDVEFGSQIGAGGLCVLSIILRVKLN